MKNHDNVLIYPLLSETLSGFFSVKGFILWLRSDAPIMIYIIYLFLHRA